MPRWIRIFSVAAVYTKAVVSPSEWIIPEINTIGLLPVRQKVLTQLMRRKENPSKDDLAIKRSLINLSVMVDGLVGEKSAEAGLHWRSFKLTQILKNAFLR